MAGKNEKNITKGYLNDIFTYDSGELKWRLFRSGVTVGEIAGGEMGNGYRRIKIDYIAHPLHRLIWIYFNGEIPNGMEIDHIDRDRRNNRIENLRIVTPAQNKANVSVVKGAVHYLGVTYRKSRNRYLAHIRIHGKRIGSKHYKTPEAAAAAYDRMAIKYRGEYTSTNKGLGLI